MRIFPPTKDGNSTTNNNEGYFCKCMVTEAFQSEAQIFLSLSVTGIKTTQGHIWEWT